MRWLRRKMNDAEQAQRSKLNSVKLAKEVRAALEDWKVAHQKLNEALEPDQIDYAIYLVEATEKRFNMLIREAKREQLDLSQFGYHLPDTAKNTLDM